MNVGYSVPGVVTGKPLEIGGSQGRDEATGRGVAIITDEAMCHLGRSLDGATVVIQGFGNVGSHAARILYEMGARIVGASDSSGGVYNPSGLDPALLSRFRSEGGRLVDYTDGDSVTNAEILELPCDILVPAALENQITAGNASLVQARVIVEGANGPTTPEADAILQDKGVLLVPDILANAGGVVVSYFEWIQGMQHYFWDIEEVRTKLEHIIKGAFREVVSLAEEQSVSLRDAALMLAVNRVAQAIDIRGVFP